MLCLEVIGITTTTLRKIVEKAERLGIDVEDLLIEALVEKLGLDPMKELEIRTELVERYFEERVRIVDS